MEHTETSSAEAITATTPASIAPETSAAELIANGRLRRRADRQFTLPDAYYAIIGEAPPDYFGVPLMHFYAERLDMVAYEVRDIVKDFFQDLAREMISINASDVDFGGPACKGEVWYRVDGNKRPNHRLGTYSEDETDLILLTLLAPFQQERLMQKKAVDFGYEVVVKEDEPPRRYRATIYFDNRHLAISMRLLGWKPRSLQSLGFHPIIERGFMFRYVRDGLTLFTGVTGSGKSTTLDAIVHANNEDVEGQILIIAQPLEYIHTSKRCVVRHREVGVDVDSFVDGMVQGLRQDPDIVIVGEMRDPDTIETTLEMSDTGHKVFSTLHTPSAIETIDRIVAEYPSDEQDRVRNRLADVLRCIVSQKLLPAVDGGRVLAKEVLWMTSSARAAIKNNNVNEIYQMIWEGGDQGMITLEQDLYRLLRSGDITPEVAVGFANNKRKFVQLMQQE